MHAFLTRWLTATPLDRLAAVFLHYNAHEEGVRFFDAYDRWIAIMQDQDARDGLQRLRESTRNDSARPRRLALEDPSDALEQSVGARASP
jgi:hypothetical protein